MKTLYAAIILFSIITGCENPADTSIIKEYPDGTINPRETLKGQIDFYTDKTAYSISDDVVVNVENETNYEIFVGLRNRTFLEMSYQKRTGDFWSNDILMPWMYMHGPTFIVIVAPQKSFSYSVKSGVFNSAGTYRFVLTYYYTDSAKTYMDGKKFSNSFVIN